MTLEECLEHTCKRVLRDINVPSLWSDDVRVRYANEGLAKIAERTHFLVDDSNYTVDLEAGEPRYELADDVKLVHSAKLKGYIGYLATCTESRIPNIDTNSRPTAFTCDAATGTLHFFPTPDTSYEAVLRVTRLPKKLKLNDANAEIELPEEWCLILADWVGYRCFAEDDADGRNDQAADRCQARFYQGLKDIKAAVYRLKMGNASQARGKRVK